MQSSDETGNASRGSADATEILPRIKADDASARAGDAAVSDEGPVSDETGNPSRGSADATEILPRIKADGPSAGDADAAVSARTPAGRLATVIDIVRPATRRSRNILAAAGSALLVIAVTVSIVGLGSLRSVPVVAAFVPDFIEASPTQEAVAAGTPKPPSRPQARRPSPSPTRKPRNSESVGQPGRPVNLPSPTGAPRPKPVTLDDYLALVPSFPPAPTPVKVNLSHDAGEAAYVSRVPTSKPVAFITIDDGWHHNQLTHDLLQRSGIPVTAFLTTNAVDDAVDFFGSLRSSGMAIENHTMTHPCLAKNENTSDPCGDGLTYEEQKAELCGASDLLDGWYGRRPAYFRAPYLESNADTIRAAWDCGLVAGFTGQQSIHAGVISWASDDHRVKPGDIMILHFDAGFADDFILALEAIKASGLTPVLLQDWVSVS
ncbi:polysaccharide deacetylase family protein [Catellatospora sichuanensis]|uniref:polysaccharide deacetylase family protein n=1 Tax=Catellatospora sichuanensis TaxID=1969805 RepID=UPI00118344EB|nr:polysaccharide deacetylase family protein [Catellatospora sichuanensis]